MAHSPLLAMLGDAMMVGLLGVRNARISDGIECHVGAIREQSKASAGAGVLNPMAIQKP